MFLSYVLPQLALTVVTEGQKNQRCEYCCNSDTRHVNFSSQTTDRELVRKHATGEGKCLKNGKQLGGFMSIVVLWAFQLNSLR